MATRSPRTYELDSETPRRLAEQAAQGGGPVLSLYLDLEPSEFATPPARRSAIRSLVDEAARKMEEAELGHDEALALKDDLDAVRRYLEDAGPPADGARAVAVFCSSRDGLFDVVRIPRSTKSRVVIGDAPYLEPLVAARPTTSWCVFLVNRRAARILRGTPERLEEIQRIEDEVHGQHDQGGWSQPRYMRSIENEVAHHVRRSLEALFTRFRVRPFDRLLVGAPQELVTDVEAGLHPYLRERLAGRVEIDVENTSPDEVRAAAAEVMERDEAARERAALDRLREGVARADGRGAAGRDDVLGALGERRVEALLLEDGFRAPGVSCPACGWLGPEGRRTCPADGTETVAHEDISERMVEAALEQSAEVIVVRRHPDLGPLGGVGALLRF